MPKDGFGSKGLDRPTLVTSPDFIQILPNMINVNPLTAIKQYFDVKTIPNTLLLINDNENVQFFDRAALLYFFDDCRL